MDAAPTATAEDKTGVRRVKAVPGLNPGAAYTGDRPVENLVRLLDARRTSNNGWIAKCPVHDDRKPSLSINEGEDGRALLVCHAGCKTEAVVAALGLTLADLFVKTKGYRRKSSRITKAVSNSRSAPTRFDWHKCNKALTESDRIRIGNERWYSRAFVEEFHAKKLIGAYSRHVAFPVQDNGHVVGAHYKVCDGWRYAPVGVKTAPFIIGELAAGDNIHIFESEWDGCAFLDMSGERSGVMITRGASNGVLVCGLIPEGATVYLWVQNDEPGEQWAKDVCAHVRCEVKRAKIPAPHKDLNDWTKAGASSGDLLQAMIDATPVLTSSNSLKSLGRNGDDDFPEPLSDLAFQGLAGEIVRRIAPHTEASDVALLVQFLTAFGNVIGRNAFIMADGSRHGMKLFAALVGESSRARKGTSSAHVLRVFKRADEDWRRDCIANGLSSGEGLIWAVRDRITKTVKDKKTGLCEDVIVDQGVADKRLTIVEGEYAQCLKVMSREGNTLSPVIRSSWDSGNLRSMTKNSPARATGAHISIVGHITRDELRRLLTETESANGFGNRFLWVAVRRSKCLPEGGNIAGENLNDLVTRLRDAIEFARYAGEVTRSEDARTLWRAVYPSLSEGKPGLLGAITARAEAQVLRLSGIYALLDCSTSIKPEHHHAALELWYYCERSARWIFSTSTGDPRADRILFALRMAGDTGMTRKQILDDVFQRNVSGNVLAGALESLHRSGLAACRKETTGGKPRELWFANKKATE